MTLDAVRGLRWAACFIRRSHAHKRALRNAAGEANLSGSSGSQRRYPHQVQEILRLPHFGDSNK